MYFIFMNINTGWVMKQCPYFEILDDVMGTRPNITPPFIYTTENIGGIGEYGEADADAVFPQDELNDFILPESPESEITVDAEVMKNTSSRLCL